MSAREPSAANVLRGDIELAIHSAPVERRPAALRNLDALAAERDRYRKALERIAASYGTGASPYRLAQLALGWGNSDA